MKSIFKKLGSYLLQGILLTVPFAVTVYVIYRLFDLIDGLFRDYLPEEIGGFPVRLPGLGFLTLLILLTLFGALGSALIAQPFIRLFQRWIERTPLIKTIYSAIQDLVSAFVGKKKRFNRPVLVKLSRESDVEKLGFVTQSDLEDIGVRSGKVAVYLPHSYAFSGNLFIVPSENITPLDASPADVMKFIVSGGVTEIDSEEENK
ncbi:MAG: DUF502 domain-containing protein [Salibacteraceae bacterium]